jgi:hypothetical protein
MEILRVVTDGKRRVVIFRRDDGLFSFRTEKEILVYGEDLAEQLNDYSTSWIQTDRLVVLCDTQEAAEREAGLSPKE